MGRREQGDVHACSQAVRGPLSKKRPLKKERHGHPRHLPCPSCPSCPINHHYSATLFLEPILLAFICSLYLAHSILPFFILPPARQVTQIAPCSTSELQLPIHIAPLNPIDIHFSSQDLRLPIALSEFVPGNDPLHRVNLKFLLGPQGSHTNILMLQIADACEIGGRIATCWTC